jgi:hypothetical protein
MTDQKAASFSFTKVRSITRPQIKIVDEVEYYFRFDSAMYLGKEIVATEGRKPMEAPTLINVVQLDTGEEGVVILHKIVSDTLKEKYPNDGYVGKCFAITIHKLQTKRYKAASITEIAIGNAKPESAGAAETSKAAKK